MGGRKEKEQDREEGKGREGRFLEPGPKDAATSVVSNIF